MKLHRDNNVLLITDVTGEGGTDTFLIDVALAGRNEGWNISALINDTSGSDQLGRTLTKSGVPVVRAPLYHGYYDKYQRRKATLDAINFFKPNIIHVFCGSPRSAITPREIAIEKGIPLFFTEAFVPEQPHFAPGIHERVHELYEQATAVTTVCRDNIRLLSRVYGFPAEKIIYVPSSIKVDPTSLEIDNNTIASGKVIKAVTAGRFVKQKGIDILIKAINLLDEQSRSKINFTIIGAGEDEQLLKNMVNNYGLEGMVSFINWQQDLSEALESFDVFIAPSRHEGGLPFTILVALAKGLPLIGSSVSGIKEALDGGELGELVEPENVLALSETIKSFTNNPYPLQKKAKKSRQFLLDNYDVDKNMKKIIDLWKGAL
ncbi:hypothetical protein GCM10008014_30370 [Paenibacillus silvae]|uniref:Glycosyl transferase family 1 domain-containing protein n=1 Tax=Paenibacillus silvae TaxID=1325358 RepID=A0ABQ1ZEL4_9BACL|nr:glycosyltransferase family 4 protein [Paenibacillus silvae]GGH58092.1 hypothetical protein GCM10008014_30370 [Paenibacillus silvae]